MQRVRNCFGISAYSLNWEKLWLATYYLEIILRVTYLSTESDDGYYLLKKGKECKSNETKLGEFTSFSADGCAYACRKHKGCKFFEYGRGNRHGRCYFKDTQSADCPEGFVNNKPYDFYRIWGKLYCVYIT